MQSPFTLKILGLSSTKLFLKNFFDLKSFYDQFKKKLLTFSDDIRGETGDKISVRVRLWRSTAAVPVTVAVSHPNKEQKVGGRSNGGSSGTLACGTSRQNPHIGASFVHETDANRH